MTDARGGPPEDVPKGESSTPGQEEQIVSAIVSDLPVSGIRRRSRAPRPRKRSKMSLWATGLRQEINRSRASLLSTEIESESDEDDPLGHEIRVQLNRAERSLEDFEQRSWLTRMFSAGATYEEILAIVQTVSEDLLLIEDDVLVQARLPALRAGIKAYLGSDDPRFDEYIRIIDRITQSSEHYERSGLRRSSSTTQKESSTQGDST